MTKIWFSRGCPGHLKGELKIAGWSGVGPSVSARFDARAVVAGTEPYNAAVLDTLRDLQVICRTGSGIDAIDLDACTDRGVMVANTPDGPTTATAEYAMALILSVSHQVQSAASRLRRGDAYDITDYSGQHWSMELNGSTLGLVGCGRIGSRVRDIASFMGMRVLITDPAKPDSIPLERLLNESDVVSLHLPCTPETTGLIDARALAAMKPGSILINCSRGPIVGTDALVDSLESGHLMGAGLDCTEPELLPHDHPLLHMDNVIVTPHVASSALTTRTRMERMAFDRVSMALRGEQPADLCNPAVLTHPRWSLV